jgi:hypothetical protein
MSGVKAGFSFGQWWNNLLIRLGLRKAPEPVMPPKSSRQRKPRL